MMLKQLQDGLRELAIDLEPAAQQKLLDYLLLLQKWNRTYNLTAIRDPQEMLTQHLLDSLSILPVIEKSALAGRHLADVGSGAGLPGIPLAIACPDLRVTLIDTVDKKTAFQRQAKIELGLSNLNVIGGRVETLPAGGFDSVISRAFAELNDFANLAGHLAPRLYAMKGVLPEDEIHRLSTAWQTTAVIPLKVPGLAAQRHLLVLDKV